MEVAKKVEVRVTAATPARGAWHPSRGSSHATTCCVCARSVIPGLPSSMSSSGEHTKKRNSWLPADDFAP